MDAREINRKLNDILKKIEQIRISQENEDKEQQADTPIGSDTATHRGL